MIMINANASPQMLPSNWVVSVEYVVDTALLVAVAVVTLMVVYIAVRVVKEG
jgi:hypothetical protein